jgi:hypothetical protein
MIPVPVRRNLCPGCPQESGAAPFPPPSHHAHDLCALQVFSSTSFANNAMYQNPIATNITYAVPDSLTVTTNSVSPLFNMNADIMFSSADAAQVMLEFHTHCRQTPFALFQIYLG